jgi:hypothetical protein
MVDIDLSKWEVERYTVTKGLPFWRKDRDYIKIKRDIFKFNVEEIDINDESKHIHHELKFINAFYEGNVVVSEYAAMDFILFPEKVYGIVFHEEIQDEYEIMFKDITEKEINIIVKDKDNFEVYYDLEEKETLKLILRESRRLLEQDHKKKYFKIKGDKEIITDKSIVDEVLKLRRLKKENLKAINEIKNGLQDNVDDLENTVRKDNVNIKRKIRDIELTKI